MRELKTIYRIRAEIPARAVEESGLLSKAREIGLNLKPDDAGNVEGAWDASILTLATVLNTLQDGGVQKPLIQRRVIAFTVAGAVSKTKELVGLLRKSDAFDVSQAEDVLSGEEILRFTVPCEDAAALAKTMQDLNITKVLAIESYQVATATS
jgi:hypothetical protein